uniref:Thymidylate kinase n=1 Tax=Candidatus Aschnera chinzeii TaxID=1485666 RepID=A0AAT9G3T8_9ENTR|nr:MAG: dTMP kinase [Candidatus Aschnera chinzeii]
MKNQYIVIEGIDGSGKSTAVQTIIKLLHEYGITNIQHIHEPGGTPLAEQLSLLIKKKNNNEKISFLTELLILYAARVQLLENIIQPSLLNGKWIISDRGDLSSQAYQGGGRGIPNNIIAYLRKLILKDIQPNLILYLDVEPIIGLQRIYKRGKLDRIEEESIKFFHQVRNKYLQLITLDNKIFKINANQSLSAVQNDIRRVLIKHFKKNES